MYALLESTVEFNSSERSILNLLVLPSIPKSQFCRQSNPSGHVVIGEEISPSTQVDSDEVGLSVVGLDVVGRNDGNEVGPDVVGWGDGLDVVGFDDGMIVVGSD